MLQSGKAGEHQKCFGQPLETAVSLLAWFDVLIGFGIASFTTFDSVLVLPVTIFWCCISSTGVFGAYTKNSRAIAIYFYWKVIISVLLCGSIIALMLGARTVCEKWDFLSQNLANTNQCVMKVGLAAVILLTICAISSVCVCYVVRRFAKAIPRIKITEGCKTRSENSISKALKKLRVWHSEQSKLQLKPNVKNEMDILKHRIRTYGSIDPMQTV